MREELRLADLLGGGGGIKSEDLVVVDFGGLHELRHGKITFYNLLLLINSV